ncbi:hypothetical protein CRI93_00005 [Longimonas halophila]|uniref:Uncharacterized protein n=1 Tax=Longimonas halophila TaxID=1469170 RepID=A0A2H3NPH9_9BACT|nr:hypothetical protein [Longimonas halophila]PEN09153.1 hypothetical protein CRI93_00005 [Longimonas halophila]
MSTLDITYSAEMMENRLQAELISPQEKFEALQTHDGHSLLFTVGTNGVLNLLRDESGKTAAGWSVTDLSSAQIARDFPDENATVKTFEAAQNRADGSLGLAMVVEAGGTSHLYLSLNNSNRDLSWAQAPEWTAYPYDDPLVDLDSLEIVNVYFCESAANVEYIVVDVLRDPSSPAKYIHRFFVEPGSDTGHYWNSHDLPIDIEAGDYDSAIGRAENGYVDGLYTAGRAGSSGQIAFVPIVNVFGEAAPTPVRLDLPGEGVPDAIASTRNADRSTDLFVVSGSSLYYFASSNQDDGATGVKVATHDVLAGTHHLVAMAHGGVITLWGRNGSDEVYSLACQADSLGDDSSWSVPVPLLSRIEKMSPYINVTHGGNTIFASGKDKLVRITRDPTTQVWTTDRITLPAPPEQPSISFKSYTTTIQVTDEEGLPQSQVTLSLSASQQTAVYINGLYYTVGTEPVHVQTTSLGSVTIVEATDTLSGTTFTVSAGGSHAVTITPMKEPFKKLTALDTPDKLTSATVTKKDGQTAPLVSSDASESNLKTVANGLKNLKSSYNQVTAASRSMDVGMALATPTMGGFAAPAPVTAESLGEDIAVAVGDLFQWLETGVDAVVDIVEDAANEVWHFVAQIGDTVYRALLDSVEAVVGAMEWVFKAVETAVEDLVRFVEFLFEWDDIRRTKEVFHNLIKRFLQSQVAGINDVKNGLDHAIEEVEKKVATWADIDDWSALGDVASQPAAGSTDSPVKGQTAASQHLAHHFQNNASKITVKSKEPDPSLLQSLIDDLFTALKNEAAVLDEVITHFEALAKDFSSLTIGEVLKRLAGILAEGVLGSAKVVIDVILDILADVAAAAVRMLDAKIHIPVVSDILNDIGVPDMSFLDLFCWIPAVAHTVVYKIAEGKAPFPDTTHTQFLIDATSMAELKQAFQAPKPTTDVPPLLASHMQVAKPSQAPGGSTTKRMQTRPMAMSASSPIQLPDSVQQSVFVAGHLFSGFFTLMDDFVTTFEAAAPTGENPWAIPSAVLGALGGGSVGLTDVLVPKDPIENSVVNWLSRGTTGLRLLNKLLFSGPVQKKFAASKGVMKALAAGDGRATGAVIDAILVLPGLACSGWHFYELSQKDAGPERTAAILGEVSNLAAYVSRVAYAVAVNDEDEESRVIIIGVMAGSNVAYAGLQTAESIAG